jgi:hypothetical protein
MQDDDGALDAMSIAVFCERHCISRALYFKMQTEKRGPRVFRIGAKVLISREAAAEWRRQREQAA